MGRLCCALAVMASIACSNGGRAAPSPEARPAGAMLALPVTFDPARNPAEDLDAAIAEAGRTGRRIVLDVGGEWCTWCHILDRFIAAHPDVKAAIDSQFVWLKINYSPENENASFLSRYPPIGGYPHLFVLDTDGTLLHSQDTALLEEGKSYDLEKVRAFLARWAL